jgi:tetratricopeptide (TPR) repeat protein
MDEHRSVAGDVDDSPGPLSARADIMHILQPSPSARARLAEERTRATKRRGVGVLALFGGSLAAFAALMLTSASIAVLVVVQAVAIAMLFAAVYFATRIATSKHMKRLATLLATACSEDDEESIIVHGGALASLMPTRNGRRIEAMTARALAFDAEGNDREALRMIERIDARDGTAEHRALWSLRAAAYLARTGRPDDALARLDEQPIEAPAAAIDEVRGVALLYGGRAAESLDPLQRALDAKVSAGTLYFMAEALRKLGREAEAHEMYRRAIEAPGRPRWKRSAETALATETYRGADRSALPHGDRVDDDAARLSEEEEESNLRQAAR